MSKAAKMRHLAQPWAGLAGAALGAGIAHQTGSDWIMYDCPDSTPVVVWLACAAGLLIVAAGAFASWPVSRRKDEPARRLVAIVSLGVSALAVMAILLPVVASVVIPICAA